MREPGAVMIPFREALGRVDGVAGPLRLDTEVVPVRAALGRVLRAPQPARFPLPPFDKSAVDGYAIPGGKAPDGYRLIGAVHAGGAEHAPLSPGTTVKVMTGAPVPEGTARVVMVEHAEEAAGIVRFTRMPDATNVCRRGENLQAGDVVLEAGRRLSPLDLGNLISAGIAAVEVTRRVRLAVLSTGDEISNDPDHLGPGRIMDSNGPMLEALALAHGLEVSWAGSAPDDPAATRALVTRALASADLVLLTGGVSEGDSDFVTPALLDLGLSVHFTRVAVKPGKPVTFASAGRQLVLAMPGNPVSAWLLFHLLALRVAAHLNGAPPEPRAFHLPLAAGYRRRNAERLEYVPARLHEDGSCASIPYHGSSHLSALARCDGFFEVAPGVLTLDAGTRVPFLPVGDGWPGAIRAGEETP